MPFRNGDTGANSDGTRKNAKKNKGGEEGKAIWQF